MKPLLVLFLFFFSHCLFAQDDIPTYGGNTITADTSTSFIIVGDLQLQSPVFEFWRENNRPAVDALCQKIATEKPGFVLMLGDLTFDGASDKLWKEFDAYAKPIRESNIPIYPLLGNHEYFTDGKKMLYEYFSRFPHLGDKLWYAVIWHDIAIITLNSNFSKLRRKERKLQIEWYERTLQAYEQDSNISAIIVACHHPPFTNSSVVRDDKKVRDNFVKPFMGASKTKLFLTGHCHAYERFDSSGKAFITSGGGGPRQKLEGPTTAGYHKDLFSSDGGIRPHHFCKVVKRNSRLAIYSIHASEDMKQWTIADSVILK